MRDVQTDRATKEAEPRWRPHDGGPMPVGSKTRVILRFRCGALSEPIEAWAYRWQNWPPEIGDSAFDIVAWRYPDPS